MKCILILTAVIQAHCDYTVPLLGVGTIGEDNTVDVLFQFANADNGAGSVAVDDESSVTVPLGASHFHAMTINQTELPIQSQIKNNTHVVSTSGDVTLQVITTIHGHSEGFQAIPNNQLGIEYYVSTMCALGGYCQMVIGSTVTGTTQVYVKLPSEVAEIGFCIGNGTWYSNKDSTITLEYPEVVQLESTHDLTGTRVYADKPVAVIGGSRTPAGTTPMYHLVEQLAPVPEWGTEFFVRPIGTTAYGNIVHITSRYRRTYVTMDGFRSVELTGLGHTVKRRIEQNSAIRIKASRPIQVMLYTGLTYMSNESISNPGMTLVPAAEHYHNGALRLTCQNTDPLDSIQLLRVDGATVTGPAGSPTVTAVPYRNYVFAEYGAEIGPSSLPLSSTDYYSGIMVCKASAIYPIHVLAKKTVSCLHTLDLAFPGDGIDNDCDGSIDEDYCYENRVFSTSYSLVNNKFVGVEPYRENITDFTVIKIRLKSCADVKIEFQAHDTINTAVSKRLVASISKERATVYICAPDCSQRLYFATPNIVEGADCDTLVPYWMVKTSAQHLCMDVGPLPDFDCSSPAKRIDASTWVFTEMIMFGRYSNAIFYYDVYRADCGTLDSDWRCENLATNCWEYKDDLCTNASYSDWVGINCRKFCGLCAPDSVGKIFAVLTPADSTINITYNLIASPTGLSYSSWNGNGDKSSSFLAHEATNKAGSYIALMTTTVPNTTPSSVHVIYTSTASHLIVTVRSTVDALSSSVYPLDAFGMEFMTLSFSPNMECDVISVEGHAQVWISTPSYTSTGFAYPNMRIPLSASDYIGTVITANRPVSVFCFYMDPSNPKDNYWAQLMPTSSWGTKYIIPALNTTSPSTTFPDATARIVTNMANTRIEISGDFVSVFILDNRGDYIDQLVDPGVSYTITSNFPIAIAVLYTETTNGSKSVLNVPPIDNYMDSAVIYQEDLPGPAYFTVVRADSMITSEPADPGVKNRLYYNTLASGSFAMSIFSDFSAIQQGVEVYNHPVHQSTHLVKDLRKVNGRAFALKKN